MRKLRFGEFLSEFRLSYNMTESDLANLYPIKQTYALSPADIYAIEHHRFKNEKIAFILDDIILSMTNFEQDITESHKVIDDRKLELIRRAAKEYISPKPAFERHTVGIPKEEIFKDLCSVVNIPYLCHQLNLKPGDEPKDLPSLLKAVRKFLGYSQRSMMEEKGEKHSVTYHKMEKDTPHNPSHEFVESLVAFLANKMQTRSFRDVVECIGSKSVAVGLVTNTHKNNCFDFEIISHNKDFTRVHPINGCRGMITIPANENMIDPQSHFIKVYRTALKNIINIAGGPHAYESEMVKRALEQTFAEMRRKFPGMRIDSNVTMHGKADSSVKIEIPLIEESAVNQ